jgi:5-keto 4-deoxyuronate isomerase
MQVRHGASPQDIERMDTGRLRAEFLIEGLFRTGELQFVYTHIDRMIIGGGCPAIAPLTFGEGTAVGTANLLDARELGIANLGAAGTVTVDGEDASRLSDGDRTALRRRAIGFVYQFHHLLPEFSALENVAMPQMIAGVPGRRALDRVAVRTGVHCAPLM